SLLSFLPFSDYLYVRARYQHSFPTRRSSDLMKTEKKPTKNVVISERDYKNLVTAARDNDKLKQHVRNLMSTDMAREYKKLSKEHGQVKEKYSGLVERFNENVNDYNELLE